jgi:hypothetical protein
MLMAIGRGALGTLFAATALVAAVSGGAAQRVAARLVARGRGP